MLALHGTGVSSGIVIGKAHVLQRELPEIPRHTLPKHQVDAEIARFTRAVEVARSHLQNIRMRIPTDAPREAASFLDTHLLILDDPTISQAPIEMMRRHRRNAEWALEIERDHLRAKFESMEDPYLREKGRDVQHVVERRPVEDAGDGVAHFQHGEPDGAARHAPAIGARQIRLAAGAADRGERPVEHADHLAKGDLAGVARERIAAARSLPADHDLLAAKFAENGVEKFLRNVVRRRDLHRARRLARLQARQVGERLEAVFPLHGEHE